MMWFGKARTAVVAFASMAISACVGLTGNARPDDLEFLAKCPPDSRKVVNELGLEPDIGLAEILDGPNVIVPKDGGVELRDGPVEVSAAIPAVGGAVGAKLSGTIRTTPDAAFIQFTKFQQYLKGDDEDRPPSGPLVDICAYASVRGYPVGPGIPKAEDPPPASELHPGFLLVTTGALGIHFAH